MLTVTRFLSAVSGQTYLVSTLWKIMKCAGFLLPILEIFTEFTFSSELTETANIFSGAIGHLWEWNFREHKSPWRNNFRWNWSRRKLINLHLTWTSWIFHISIFFPAIIHKKYFKKHFNVVSLFFNKIGELNGWAISTLSPRKKKVIKTNLLRATWLPRVYSHACS